MTNTEPVPSDNFPTSRFTKAQRQYLYVVVTALVPVLAISSAFVAGNAQIILVAVAAVLGITGGATAASNTVTLPKS